MKNASDYDDVKEEGEINPFLFVENQEHVSYVQDIGRDQGLKLAWNFRKA